MRNNKLRRIMILILTICLIVILVMSFVLFIIGYINKDSNLENVAAIVFTSILGSLLLILTLRETMETNIKNRNLDIFRLDRIKNRIEQSTSLRSIKMRKYGEEPSLIDYVCGKRKTYLNKDYFNFQNNIVELLPFSIRFLCDDIDAINYCIIDELHIGMADKGISIIDIEPNNEKQFIIRNNNNRFDIPVVTQIDDKRFNMLKASIQNGQNLKLVVSVKVKLFLNLGEEEQCVSINSNGIMHYVKRTELKNDYYFKRNNDNELYLYENN